MQRYSFFGHEPNISREKFAKEHIFNSYLHLKRRDGGVTFYYTCEAGGRVGAHKRLLEGRDRGRGTRNTRRTRCFIGRGEKIEGR